ncbi:MAG: TPM domain-containing protein [Bacteroidetes bacterium]|nr:MAG: TPM domain-containing protein [Bacteroidota bacterium]
MIRFFNKQEEASIIEAIREAECVTSGEIRVHLEKKLKGDVLQTATRVFHELGMDATEQRNGVLIFLAPHYKKFAIIGDKGINEKVPPGFWEDIRNVMQKYFREGNFVEGIRQGVRMVGEKLQAFFPYQSDDINELPDDISYSQ